MKIQLVFVSLFLAASQAPAQEMPKWGYPDPEVFAKGIQALCEEQHLSVMLATRYRDQGKSKADVLALIPPNSPSLQLRAIDAYRESVQDVFDFPQYGLYAMQAFRAEACRREVMSARTLARLSTVHEKIGACEAKNGKAKSSDLYACVREIVTGM